MDNLSLQKTLLKALRLNSKYCSEDGVLLKNKIIEEAHNLSSDLLSLLLSDTSLKKHFFSEVGSTLVFDKVKFQRFVSNKSFLPDSFTAYKNKIGLTTADGQDFISDSGEVVLTWPYKDCILEGGQTKEDEKRDELFFNEILAPDEINRLLEPKALAKFSKYTVERTSAPAEISMSDNFFIRGNNLLVLSSLLEIYRESIQLIFIDPPYNTENDSFGYNDTFKHSTWCTFMHNRLSIANKLLKASGTLAISIDHNELCYCMAVADSIFGRENLKNIITVKRGSVTGAKVINPGVVNLSDYVLIYAKDSSSWNPNRVLQAKERDDRYNQFIVNIEDNYENWRFIPLTDAFAAHLHLPKKSLKKVLGDSYETEITKFVIANSERVMQLATLDENSISEAARELKAKSIEDPFKVYYMEREGKNPYYVLNGKLLLFVKDRLINVGGELSFGQPISDIWDDVLPNDLHNEGGVVFRKGKKPEKLLHRIIDLTTKERDIVLDFFSGSGTTCAVALKMGRRFIGVEQLDYGDNDTVHRLQNVIGHIDSNGNMTYDTRGVSSITNWRGGGSFIYCELAKANANFAEEIQDVETDETLNAIWERMKESSFISYKIKPSTINVESDDFTALSLEDKKRFLMACLDKNLLYVPLSDIDSEDYCIIDEDKRLNHLFYKK